MGQLISGQEYHMVRPCISQSFKPDPLDRQYHIAHKIIKTGEYGHGSASFDREAAQAIRDEANREWAGVATHWIIPAD